MRLAELEGRSVLVVGGGLTGASVARLFERHAVAFDLVDDEGVPPSLAARVVRGQVHARLDEALACRHDVLVLSPGVPRAHPAVRAALAAGRRVVGDIELFADRVRAPVIAVTGSNGKSTVVAWLADLLGRLGIRAVASGNIGLPALDSLEGDVECHVLEVSSYQLESTFSLAPHAAAVLNVSEDHLDRYASVAAYAAVKRRVLERAAHVVVNADDPATAPLTGHACIARFTLRETLDGIDPDARPDARPAARLDAPSDACPDADTAPLASLWHRERADGRLWLCRDGTRLLEQAALGVPGDHNAANALAVLALLESLRTRFPERLAPAATLDALSAFRGLPHRTELVAEADGVRWYDDSKGTNVDACGKALAAMPGPVVLIAGGLSKGADFTPLRPLVAARVRALVLIGRDAPRLRAALDGAVALHDAASLEEAVRLARALARPGDAVLLSPACASFDMFDGFEDRGRRFVACVDEVLSMPQGEAPEGGSRTPEDRVPVPAERATVPEGRARA